MSLFSGSGEMRLSRRDQRLQLKLACDRGIGRARHESTDIFSTGGELPSIQSTLSRRASCEHSLAGMTEPTEQGDEADER